MATLPKNTKFHFTHPNHPLLYHSEGNKDYICGGCKTSGSGSRFRCHSCDFNLHEYCADCPEKLSSSVHHHPLTLVLRKPDGVRMNERFCDICLDAVDGLFYRCKDCDYDAHPLCTQLPKELRHVVDNRHFLKLQKLQLGSCAVCKKDCSSLWVYGCEICRVNIHLDCIFEPYDSPTTQWREPPVPPPSGNGNGNGTTSRGIPPPWGGGAQTFPGGGFPWNNSGYNSGGPFAYGFDAKPYPYPYGNYVMGGGHFGAYGYAAPYGVPDHHFLQPNYGFVQSNVNHWGSQAVNNAGPPPTTTSEGKPGKSGKSMFALVGRLTLGVMSSVIFGFPLSF